MKRALRRLVWGAVALLAAMLPVQRTAAHKPITSKYTYNHDVFPIFRDRCSRCHVTGGVAPMSLVTYEDAFPWAQSLQSELIVGTMPPATADVAYGAIKQAQPLAAKYLDVILGDRRLRRLALHDRPSAQRRRRILLYLTPD